MLSWCSFLVASTADRVSKTSFSTAAGLLPETRIRSWHTQRRVFLLRHKSDTIDLLESGFVGLHELQGSLAQRQGAGGARRGLQLARRGARYDQLAQVVVQDEQLADRFPSLEAGAAALAA